MLTQPSEDSLGSFQQPGIGLTLLRAIGLHVDNLVTQDLGRNLAQQERQGARPLFLGWQGRTVDQRQFCLRHRLLRSVAQGVPHAVVMVAMRDRALHIRTVSQRLG